MKAPTGNWKNWNSVSANRLYEIYIRSIAEGTRLLDSPSLCQYKHAMKSLRLFLALGLVAVLLACSANPNGPLLPFGPTYTPSPSATPTVTATSTPSPTPSPLVRVESGDHALFNGDYDLARAEYQQALNQSGQLALRAEALWGLGRTEYEAGNYDKAISYFNQITNEYPDTTRAVQAHFLLGEAYKALDRHADAAAQYGAYLSLRPGYIEAYALEVQGDAYFNAQNYVEALGVYNSANLAPRLDNGIDLQIKVAQTRTAIGDYATALALYDAIAAQTGNDYVRAQMDYLAGSAYLNLGQPENAH